jgi:tetratricopeptide (TPR) repeat protein
VVVILAVTIVTRIIPWLVFNAELRTEFVKQMLADDIHYSEQYGKGERLDGWGYLLYKIGDHKGAKEAWKERLTFSPDQPNTLSLLAPLLFKMGEFPEAYQTYLRMLELQPDNLEYRYYAAYLLFRMADYDGAFKVISSFPPGFSENPSVRRLSAGLLGAAGHHQEAVDIIVRIPPEAADGYLSYMLAKSCLAVDRNDLARQLIGRALELDSANQSYRELADRISQPEHYPDTTSQ